MRVEGKSIIVTGAGGGIGEGIARRLASEGAAVIVNDITPRRAKRSRPTSTPLAAGRALWRAT